MKTKEEDNVKGDPKGSWGIGGYLYIEDDGEERMGYGYYRPEDPNDFFPDASSCDPCEIANHKAAVAEFNK